METKKLTCRDLMIGDYFRYKDGTIVRIARVGDVSPMDAPIYCRTQLEGYFPCQFEDIEPIPLTAEILEKVGFVKHRDVFYRLAIRIDEFNGFMLTLGRDFDGVFCLQSNRFVRFSYVHELQHALRLCGVDEEIVL